MKIICISLSHSAGSFSLLFLLRSAANLKHFMNIISVIFNKIVVLISSFAL